MDRPLPGMSAPLDVVLVEIADDDLLARGDPRPGVDHQLVAFEDEKRINKQHVVQLFKVCLRFLWAHFYHMDLGELQESSPSALWLPSYQAKPG